MAALRLTIMCNEHTAHYTQVPDVKTYIKRKRLAHIKRQCLIGNAGDFGIDASLEWVPGG